MTNYYSQSITNLSSTPFDVKNVSGEGAPGMEKVLNDFYAVTAAELGSTASKFFMVRLFSNVKLKRLKLESDGQLDSNGTPTLAVDVGAYYSNDTNDGTQPALQGTAISVNCFAAAKAFGANTAASPEVLDVTPSVALRNEPLWATLGLSSDPGGMIDVVVAVHTAAATAVAGNIGIQADYVY